jgi:hypothetical protein
VCWPDGTVNPHYALASQRAVLLAGMQDVLVVDHPIDHAHLSFLNGIGVGPRPQNVIVLRGDSTSLCESLLNDRHALHLLRRQLEHARAVQLDAYIVTAASLRLRAELEMALHLPVLYPSHPSATAHLANNKCFVRDAALTLGVPVAAGEVVNPAQSSPPRRQILRDAIVRQMCHADRVIIRGALGTGGSSTFVIQQHNVEDVLDEIERGDTPQDCYLVEQMVELTCSPNIITEIFDDQPPRLIGSTDQILSPSLHHAGNRFPSQALTLELMRNSALVLSRWLGGIGYRGIAGFDFVEYLDPRTDRPAHLLAEINARMNAACYPLAMMDHINTIQRRHRRPLVGGFVNTNVPNVRCTFTELAGRAGDLLFDPQTGSGIVPFRLNWEKAQISIAALADSPATADALYRAFVTAAADQFATGLAMPALS